MQPRYFLLVVEEPELAANPIRSVGRYLTFAWILLLFSEIDGAFTFENAFFARACHVRALQRFLSFCFHNLHQTPQSFPKKGKKNLPISESRLSSLFAIFSLYSWNICEPRSLYHRIFLINNLLCVILWRLWKQKVWNRCNARVTRTREGMTLDS